MGICILHLLVPVSHDIHAMRGNQAAVRANSWEACTASTTISSLIYSHRQRLESDVGTRSDEQSKLQQQTKARHAHATLQIMILIRLLFYI